MKITEAVIVRVATMLSFDVGVEEIRATLLKQGMSEYNIFLTVKAGETYNTISDRTYSEAEEEKV